MALMLLASGCATTRSDGSDDGRFGWQMSEGSALFGVPHSEASLIIECRADERAVRFAMVGRADAPAEMVRIVVDGVSFSGIEVPGPDDGIEIGYIAVPIDDPVVTQIARGARRIAFHHAESRGSVPAGAVPAAMAKACRKQAAG